MTGVRNGPHADRVFRVAGGSVLAETTADLTATVDSSWRRCLHEFKLDPARDYQPTVLDRSRVRDLQAEHRDLIEIARAEMDSLYEQIAGSGYALLLADTDGVILCEKVDPALKGMFTHAGLIVGAEWSEQREGTNGIGTCAKEARPITIHQTDHFRSRHAGLSCSAAPIRDSNGRVVAVLDASSVNTHGSRDSKMHTVALVETSARLIEKCLFLRRHRADAMLRFHYRPEFVDLLHDGAIAVAVDGTIVASDATGLKLLGAADRSELVGRSITDVFDASYEELVSAGLPGRRSMRELRDNQFGRRYYAEKPAQRAKDRRQQRVGVDLGPDGLRQGGLRQSPALRQQAGGACVHRPLEHAEREVLLGVIAQHRWNMSQVAAQLGISRNTLYRKIKRHGIVIARRPGGC